MNAAPAGRRCPACHEDNPPTARFCSACGARMPVDGPAAPDAAERRHLSVLFADLVGSTRLAAGLDPEDWRSMVRAYQDATAAVVARYDGHVAQFLGDGVLVYFGYPRAHENDAERAMLAGLGIVEAMKSLDAGAAADGLAVRIGVHTGPVVVGQMGRGARSETLAMGHTMNVAARLQGLAEPNTVVVSEITRRLAAGQFVTRDLGTPALKGIDEEVRAHRVLQASGMRSRLDAPSRLTPFVGRDGELDRLSRAWEGAQRGEGQVALVTGEPGVGKSRLMLALRQRIAESSHTWLECRCSPYGVGSAFAPVRELIEQGLGFAKTDSSAERLARLMGRVGRDGLSLGQAMPALAALLEIDVPGAAPALSAEALREQTLQQLVAWATALSDEQPVLMLVEDLHWCDPSSLEFLDRLIARTPGCRLFVLMTARPSFDSPWKALPGAGTLALAGLDSAQSLEVVQQLCARSALPAEACERIVARADGVPLHLEELTRMLQEAQSGRPGARLDDVAIPETLEGSLMARLDQLNDAKRVAQVASLLGREFEPALLRAVSTLDAGTLQAGLDQLVAAGLLFTRQSDAEPLYIFKHALIQDASYNSLLKSQRRDLHGRTARALLELDPAGVARRPELAARHFGEAEDWLPATRHWLAAGQLAGRTSASQEAIAYLRAGLDCVVRLQDPAHRAPLELELLLALGPPLMATRGYADEDVERGYSRARELCRLLGEPPAVFPVLFGLWTYHCLRAKHVAGRELASDMARLAASSGDEGLRVEADLAMGANLFYLGEFEGAGRSLARSVASYDPQREEAHRYLYGQDPRVGALGYEAFTLWLLGQDAAACARSESELVHARALDHPFTLTYALTFAAWFQRLRGDGARSEALAQELRALATERGVSVYAAVGVILCGVAMVERGEIAEGLALLESGIGRYRQTGSSVLVPYWLTLHAQALQQAGRLDDALAALDEGWQAAAQTQERWCEAELLRQRAAVLAARGAPRDEVLASFEQAIATARSQGARGWLWRAALDHQAFDPDRARLQALRDSLDERATAKEAQALRALIDRPD